MKRGKSHESLKFLGDDVNLLYPKSTGTVLSSFAWTALNHSSQKTETM